VDHEVGAAPVAQSGRSGVEEPDRARWHEPNPPRTEELAYPRVPDPEPPEGLVRGLVRSNFAAISQPNGDVSAGQRLTSRNSLLSLTHTETETDDDEPIRVADWPVLPDMAMQGVAGQIVKMIDPSTEADPAAVLAHLLSAAGVWFDASPRLYVADQEFTTMNIGAGLSSGEGLIEAVRDQVGDDPDAKGFIPGVSDKRLLLVETEFTGVLARIRRDGNTLAHEMRKAWDGTPMRTMTRSPLRADTHHIGIIGHVSPEELRTTLRRSDFTGGTVNRFLMIMSKRSKYRPWGSSIPDDVLTEAAGLLMAAKAKIQLGNQLWPMSTDAVNLWRSQYKRLADGMSGDGAEAKATDRARPQVLRLALGYSLVDASERVEDHHMAAALGFWDYSVASARYVFGDPVVSAETTALLAFIGAAGTEGVTRSELSVKHFQRHKTAREIDAVLAPLLVDDGPVCQEKVIGGAGRAPVRFMLRSSVVGKEAKTAK
jgi:hypothetical protein